MNQLVTLTAKSLPAIVTAAGEKAQLANTGTK
jgi:hypothetical protein